MSPMQPTSRSSRFVPTRPGVRSRRRGQAMLEYSIITWALVVALVLASSVRIIPGPKENGPNGPRKNLIEMFLESYQTYYDSFYFVLNLPVP